MRQKRLRRFQNDGTSSDSSLSMGPIAITKHNKGKGKAKAGLMNGLSVKEQRNMSGTPDPVFNPVCERLHCMFVNSQSDGYICSLQDVIDWDDQTIVGTSQQLEKPYLRLTSVSVAMFGYNGRGLIYFRTGSRSKDSQTTSHSQTDSGAFETEMADGKQLCMGLRSVQEHAARSDSKPKNKAIPTAQLFCLLSH